MDVRDLLNEEMEELLIQMDHSVSIFFGVAWNNRWDWKKRQQRKLVFLIDELGDEVNLLPIFDSDDEFCTAVKHEIVDENLLECTAADLPRVDGAIVGDWQGFLLKAAEGWIEEEEENGDTVAWAMKVGRPTRDAVCYADHLTQEIHRNTADAIADYERQLDEMVKRHS